MYLEASPLFNSLYFIPLLKGGGGAKPPLLLPTFHLRAVGGNRYKRVGGIRPSWTLLNILLLYGGATTMSFYFIEQGMQLPTIYDTSG